MFECSLEDLFGWRGPRFIAVASDSVPWAEETVGDRASVLALPDGSSQGRLAAVAERLRELRQSRWLLVNRPAPAMTSLCLNAAAAALIRGESAIGPAADGRPALLGTAADARLLGRVNLERATASSHIARCLRGAGSTVTFVNPGPGIDCPSDIGACRRELDGDDRPARARLRFLLSVVADTVQGGRAWLSTLPTDRCPSVAV